jgi:hypothetical protein
VRRLGVAAAALLAVGCARETGLMVEVQGPAGVSSTQAGIAKLDFVVAHRSWCERWVGDATAMHTTKDVSGRDLEKKPYQFLITPTHQTDLAEPVYVAALAYAADGQLVGRALFGAHPFAHGKVLERAAPVQLFGRASQPEGPKYVDADGGCVCMPGQPWIGNGAGSGCDSRVVTSFARLVDTAGCELPAGAPLPDPVCDGQAYREEATDRDLPCWADDGQGACRVTLRHCADHDGVAWGEECHTGPDDVMLPAGSELCQRYLACEQQACGDVVGCFRDAFTQKATIKCTLPIDPSTAPGEKIQPCPNGKWQAPLPLVNTSGAMCITALVDGVEQPPFTLGLVAAGQSDLEAVTATCPATLQIEAIDAPYPEAVPETKELDLVAGEHLVHVTINVVRQCTGEASLVCSPQ